MKHITLAKKMLLVLLPILLIALAACSSDRPLADHFSLSTKSLTLMEGKTEVLQVNDLKSVGEDAYAVYWTSDDAAVATVDSAGTVAAKGVGQCTVTAMVRMGEDEIQLTCAVTVTENTLALSSIAFKASIYTVGDKQTLDLRNEIQLYPEDAPKPQLAWSSSNTSIASVSDGLVIPTAPGIATIKASTTDGTVFATCLVQVSANTVQATGLTLDATEMLLSVGQTKILKAVVAPADATGYSLSWTSSDPAVVSVDGGIISALAEGTSKITATLNMANGVLTAECTVTVERITVEVEATRVSILPDTMKVPSNDTTEYSFEAKVEPANCTQIAVWTCNRPDLITLDEKTGKFSLKGVSIDTASVAVLVTCTVGTKSSVAVLYIEKPDAIIIVEPKEIVLFDKAPKNTHTLTAYLDTTDNPIADVVWKSSDPTVATVDDQGNVTALKAGACVISASYQKNGKTFSDGCAVTVEEAPYLLLTEGETLRIPDRLLPENPSSDPEKWYYEEDFLEVDAVNKTVKALKYTTILLRVSMESADGKESASFDVYILPAPSTDGGSDTSSDGTTADTTDDTDTTDSVTSENGSDSQTEESSDVSEIADTDTPADSSDTDSQTNE